MCSFTTGTGWVLPWENAGMPACSTLGIGHAGDEHPVRRSRRA